MYTASGIIPHGIHEDWWQEFGENDATLRTNQLVRQNLGEQIGSLFSHCWIGGIAVEIKQVYQSTWKSRK